MATDKTLQLIYRFQKKLEKYVSLGQNEKLLYCIHKLKYLPVTVEHLELTGVGKSINSLRHQPGEVGDKSKVLVTKWKGMVTAQEEKEKHLEVLKKQKEEETIHKEIDLRLKEKSNVSSSLEVDSDENDCLHIQEQEVGLCYVPSTQDRINAEENGYDPTTSREDYMLVGNNSLIGNSSYKPTSSSSDSLYKPTSSSDSFYKPESVDKNSYKPASVDKNPYKPESVDKNIYKPVSVDKNSYKPASLDKNSYKPASVDKNLYKPASVDKNPYKPASVDKNPYKPAYSPIAKSSETKNYSPLNNSDEEMSNETLKKEDEKRKKKHRKSRLSSKEPSNNNSSSSSSSSHKRKKEKSESRSRHESKDRNKKDKERRKHKNKSCDDDLTNCSQESLRDTSNHSTSLTDSDHSPPKSLSHKPSSSSKKDLYSPDLVNKSNKENKSRDKHSHRQQESSSGFEAALMGMDIPSKKKKNKKQKQSKPEKPSSSHSTLKHIIDPILPDLSDEDFEINNEPKLLANYKPLPQVPQRNVTASNFSVRNTITEEEALDQMFSSKQTSFRCRKMYTGKVSNSMSTVPSLFNCCIKVLQDNVSMIETYGSATFDIMKPVLEKATPQELFTLEDFNPSLLDDSETLWEAHCKRTFKFKVREDMETWRELFIRSTDENSQKIRTVTENLHKKYVVKKPDMRKTKLAFINTTAKAPKSVARAQAIFGTGSSSSKSSHFASKTGSDESSSTSSSKYINNQHPKPDRVPSQSTRPPAAKKPKVAPLMAKSRKLMKTVCRR